jgi:hypothetical protein
MAKVIKFEKRSPKEHDSLITSSPWEFRKAVWRDKHFIQVLKIHWNGFEYRRGNEKDVPPHFVLKNGLAHTIHGIYAHRNNKDKMKEVYFLAGLIDCMINRINPVLRTDLIRDMYKKIRDLKRVLNINWYGHMDRVLLPIDIRFFDHLKYENGLSEAATLKELYDLIMKGTDEMFHVLSSEYIFFTPNERS